jgi:hypothetical protein
VTHTLEREETDGLQGLGLETEKREKDKLNARALVPQASPSFLLVCQRVGPTRKHGAERLCIRVYMGI